METFSSWLGLLDFDSFPPQSCPLSRLWADFKWQEKENLWPDGKMSMKSGGRWANFMFMEASWFNGNFAGGSASSPAAGGPAALWAVPGRPGVPAQLDAGHRGAGGQSEAPVSRVQGGEGPDTRAEGKSGILLYHASCHIVRRVKNFFVTLFVLTECSSWLVIGALNVSFQSFSRD